MNKAGYSWSTTTKLFKIVVSKHSSQTNQLLILDGLGNELPLVWG